MNITITAVDKKLFDGSAYSVTVPGSEGELTVLSGHEPFVTTLKEGLVRVRKERDSEQETFPVESGVLEVSKEGAILLI